MKKLLCILALFSFLAGALYAGDDDFFDEDTTRVLEEARRRANSSGRTDGESSKSKSSGSTLPASDKASPQDADESEQEEKSSANPMALFPFAFSPVPGVILPFGEEGVIVHVGLIGTVAESVNYIQASSIFNISLSESIVQAAGVFNLGATANIQAAGVFNVSSQMAHIQTAGVFNIAEKVDGIQVAGVFNINNELKGLAVAGVFNISKKATGLLISIVNVVDELDGYAFGLVNIIGNGYQEICVDYVLSSNVLYPTYRSGIKSFYSLLYAGVHVADLSFGSGMPMTSGFGLGTRSTFGNIRLSSELCIESLVGGSNHDWRFPRGTVSFEDIVWNTAFLSLRVALSVESKKKSAFTFGMKADICLPGSTAMPDYLQNSFGSEGPIILGYGAVAVEIYPKLFIGLSL